MCNFLVHKKADVNAIEPDLYGFISYVLSTRNLFFSY